MTVDYSIVIPAFNEQAFLGPTLLSVAAAMASVRSHRGEIVVCDNDSTDATADIARAAGARVVFESHRQIARARNAGGAAARGRALIFVDADTTFDARLLRETLDLLDSGTVCGGGTMVRFDRSEARWLAVGASAWNLTARSLGWACGAYVFCLAEGFRATGGFDERYYATEELHFCRALKRWGAPRGLRFRLLDTPIVTSARKLDWFGRVGLLRILLGTALRPWALRRRSGCALWYTRP